MRIDSAPLLIVGHDVHDLEGHRLTGDKRDVHGGSKIANSELRGCEKNTHQDLLINFKSRR
jgi:hypothetical protein